MKKVLTVLLAIAVVFTFSFGSAFAATTYNADDYNKVYQTEKEFQLGVLKNVLTQVVGAAKFNDEGFTIVDSGALVAPADKKLEGYMKEAIEEVGQLVIDDAEKAMDDAINSVMNTQNMFPTDTAPDKATVSAAADAYSTKDAMLAKILAKTVEDSNELALDKAQAPLTKKAVEAKLDKAKAAVDDGKYNSTDKDYTDTDSNKITAADKVLELIDDAKDALKTAADDKDMTYAAKRAAYETAYSTFKTAFDQIDTLADEDFNNIDKDTVNSKKADEYATHGYGQLPVIKNMKSDDTLDWSGVCKNALKDFWEGTTKTSKDGKFFDVAIVNYEKVTRTEAVAVYNAMKTAITDSKTAVLAWANDKKTNDIDTLYDATVGDASGNSNFGTDARFFETLRNAMDAADKYADVVKEGNKLKARYDWGVKQYNDAKVDAAVKNAEGFVYGDLKDGFYDKAVEYIVESANDIESNTKGLENLEEDGAKYAADKFRDALDDAAEKMYKKGFAKGEVTKKVSYGADKTADEDLVYLLGTYYTGRGNDYISSQEEDWKDIANDTLDALQECQSYDEITAVMKKAADDFSKLMKDDDADDVEKAMKAYEQALKGYIAQKKGLLDDEKDYTKAYAQLKEKGMDLITDATTVDGVKAAYAEAQALVDNAKTNDELKDMKKAVEKKINALPAYDKLTSADRDAVKEAYKAYCEYKDLAGADDISELVKTALTDKYNRVNTLLKDEIAKEAEDLLDKMEDLDTSADADLPKYIALKEEAKALVAKGTALTDEIDDVKDEEHITLAEISFGTDYAAVKEATNLDATYHGSASDNTPSRFYDAEILNAKTLLIAASKPNATPEQMKAAVEAYNALTDRQQMDLDGGTGYYLELVKVATEKIGTTVKELKITAKSTAKKGSITVTWTVKGSADIDGYEVWKSTKHSKGYKKAFTTKKQTYKNTKGLKKGTRYYYKVRAYKMVEGKKITSDWSNKARRVAK